MTQERPLHSPSDSFENARQMAELTRQQNPELAPLQRNPEVAIDQRRVGNVLVTGVIGTHTAENGATFGQALANCQIVAIESPGIKDADTRKRTQDFLTAQLTADHEANHPDEVSRVFTGLAEQSPVMAEILTPLRGSGKQIVLLDVNANDPQYHKIEAEKAGREQFVANLTNLQTVAFTREALQKSITATAQSHEVRDPAMKQEILDLIAASADQDPPPNIGVVVGSLHSEIVTSLGEPVSEELSDQAQLDIEANYSLYDQAIMATKTGQADAAERLTERILLSAYGFKTFREAEATYKIQQADDFTQEFDDEAVAGIIGKIDELLQYQTFAVERRKNEVDLILNAVDGIAKDRKRIKQHRQYAATTSVQP